MTQNKARDVKLVAAGDGSVGKTCLLMTYAYNKFSEGYVPTVFDTYDMELLVEGQSISRKFLNVFNMFKQMKLMTEFAYHILSIN